MMLKLVVLSVLTYVILISFVVGTESYVLLMGLLSALPVSVYLVASFGWQQRRNDAATGAQKRRPAKKNRKARNGPSFPFIIIYMLPIGIAVAIAMYQGYALLEASTLYSVLISFGLSLSFSYALVNLPLAIKHKQMEQAAAKKQKPLLFFPSVTIIVPAYNEEAGIERTLDALLEVDYPNKEVIVVDDGSKDRTWAIASSYINRAPPGRFNVIKKENGGKASAINSALRFAKGEIIVVIDADAIIARDTLKELVRQFEDDSIAAIAGNPKVLNRGKFLARIQVLEYAVGVSLFKRAYAFFGVVMVVPGGLGAFRKEYLVQSGLYDSDTLTEDFDITIKVLKMGKKVVMAATALSYSEVPERVKDLYKQRLRWQGGNLQTLLKHKDVMSDPKYGMVYKYGYPLVLLTMLTLPFLGMVVTAFIFIAILYDLWFMLLIAFVIFTSLQFVLGAIAIMLDEDDWKSLAFAPLMVVGYKQLLDFFTIKSTLDVVFKRNLRWNPSTRYGMVASNISTATLAKPS
ncbi:glycosyltransferase [Nitrososphaera sp.]|uniref:glycosyltransferase family 2 protein n=1 Tax=Nitrososphaera sp. TaxID=1971748 RepID=UPI00307EFCFB